jgi:glycosyltransferase involved in cell wall biosynthesis
MRIAIDCQGAQNSSRDRGIGRYTTSLLSAIIRQRDADEIILLLNGLFPESIKEIRKEYKDVLGENEIVVWNANSPVASLNEGAIDNRKEAQLARDAAIASINPDLVIITSYLDCLHDDTVSSLYSNAQYKSALIFYDAIPLLLKDVYLKPNPHFEKIYMEKIGDVKNSNLLFAISESARQEAIDYLDFPASNAININAGVDPFFKKIEINQKDKNLFFLKFGIKSKFILYSGASDERKNHIRLIEAFSLLPKEIRKSCQLVLAGGLPEKNRQNFLDCAINHGLRNDELIITGFIGDDDLLALYNLCELFVFPSLHEGFGLPVLEAMVCGAPVIGSNTTSIPEIIVDERFLFDPGSARNISSKIVDLIANEELRLEAIVNGRQQCQRFSWDKSALILLNSSRDWYRHRMAQTIKSRT